MTSSLFFIATVLIVNAPALPKEKTGWLGVNVCFKKGNPETFILSPGGEFELKAFALKYLDVRVVQDKKDYVAVQHDADVFWVKKTEVLRPLEAVDHYTKEIDADNSDLRAVSARCWAFIELKKWDLAIKDANAAINLNPASPSSLNNRGEVYLKKKEFDKAIDDFSTVLSRNPNYHHCLMNRADAYVKTRQFAKAIEDSEKAIKLNVVIPSVYANLARSLAVSPDAKIRDGKRAIELAKKAIAMIKYRDGRFHETLAAAYAETGDFEKAIEELEKATSDIDFMKEEGDNLKKRLARYREKKPYRDE